MAATQRPVSAIGFGSRPAPPAWKSLPSWAVVATGDTAAGADVVRSMAERAGAQITEVEGSHVVFISRPDAVAGSSRTALAAASAPAVSGRPPPPERPAATVSRYPGGGARPRPPTG